jgi:hypothetical protein
MVCAGRDDEISTMPMPIRGTDRARQRLDLAASCLAFVDPHRGRVRLMTQNAFAILCQGNERIVLKPWNNCWQA